MMFLSCAAQCEFTCVVLGVTTCFLMVQSFTPYRTAQRPIVTATQVGSHIRVGETPGCAVQLLFAMSSVFLAWQFALSFGPTVENWVVWAFSSLETYLSEFSERIKEVSTHAGCSKASLAWLSSFTSRWAKPYRWWVEQILSCFASCVPVWECGFSSNCL